MCLTKPSRRKTAILPLIVFKGASETYKINDKEFQSSSFLYNQTKFIYPVGEETEYVDITVDNRGREEVNEGYHSFRFLLHKDNVYYTHGIFIIPRGAKYFNGKNNGETFGRCASSMIYVGPANFKNYLKALGMKLSLVTTKYK